MVDLAKLRSLLRDLASRYAAVLLALGNLTGCRSRSEVPGRVMIEGEDCPNCGEPVWQEKFVAFDQIWIWYCLACGWEEGGDEE